MSDEPVMLRRAPFKRMRWLVQKALKDELSAGEMIEYRHPDNLVLRLLVLRHVRRDTESSTGEQRKYVKSMQPLPGVQPSEEYIEARRVLQDREGRRLKFMRHLDMLIEEAKSEIGIRGLKVCTLGDVIDTLTSVRVMIERAEYEGAIRFLNANIEWLMKLTDEER